MLRPRNHRITITLSILLLSGSIFAQTKKGGEVTLTKCWQFPVENVVALATNGSDIFGAAEGGKVFALSSKGEKLWQTDLGGELQPGIVLSNDAVIVTTMGASDTQTRQLSLAAGIPLQHAQDPPGFVASQTIELSEISPIKDPRSYDIHGGPVPYVYGDAKGVIASVSADGKTIWKFKAGGKISAFERIGETVVAISNDNFIYSLDVKNGGLRWKKRLQGRVAHYLIAGEYLFISALDQHGALLIDLATGRVAGQIAFDGDDQLAADPVAIGDSFTIATNAGLAGYSLSGCGQKETASKP